ncbi:MAG: glucosyl-3-phosphoglycerate synthase [Kineosporiaceae bacterium]
MIAEATRWFTQRTSTAEQWPLAELVAAKARTGSRISVVIPARDEQVTIEDVVRCLRRALIEDVALIDELVVVDSDSRDRTADLARRAGATVVSSAQVRPDLGSNPGKGEAIWKSLFATTGDVLVFVDADLTHFGPHFVTGLVGPLLNDPELLLVKGFYDRILDLGDEATPDGGRVTELVARPLLNLWWPQLSRVVQPLAGEWAARRSLLESVSIPTGYGVELATLLDTCALAGLDAVAQVDLGARAHRHQAVHDLGLMAAELLVVADGRRAGGDGRPIESATLSQFRRGTVPPGSASEAGLDAPSGAVDPEPPGHWRVRPVPLLERPPAVSVDPPVAVWGSAC